MSGEIEKLTVTRLSEEGRSVIEDVVARETPVTLLFNNQELVTLLATPKNLDYLAAGFLFSEGLIRDRKDVRKILVDDRKGVVRVETAEEAAESPDTIGIFKRIITSGCGRGASFYSAADVEMVKVESQTRLAVEDVLSLAREFQHRSELYRSTGGVHSAALCDAKSILVFNEDIGRHNAVDKVMGECLMKDIATDDRIVITSGRISSEMLLKIAKRNIPLIISKSAPTDLGVKLANDLGITLLGFVRGKRMNVYAHDWRIVTNA